MFATAMHRCIKSAGSGRCSYIVPDTFFAALFEPVQRGEEKKRDSNALLAKVAPDRLSLARRSPHR
jgi:hypothetical protein